jgi:outer membrane protein assembly factor BamB
MRGARELPAETQAFCRLSPRSRAMMPALMKPPVRACAVLFALLAILLAFDASAVGTRRFVLQNAEDFKGGDLEGVAIDSSGRVHAGLSLGAIPVTDASAIWSALLLGDGSVLLGTGNEGKLLRVRGQTVSVAAETKALVVTSLSQAWGGAVAVGTLPDGKIFRFERDKLTELASLPGAEHVWQMAFDRKTNSLFVATGPEGKLFRVGAGGEAQVYFDAEEQHLMSVAVAADGTVYTGASDKAKLYKITAPGRASVLHDFGRTEVRAIAIGPKGDIFAIANEIKAGSHAPKRKGRPGGVDATAQPVSTPGKTKGKGTLYRFATDGTPDQLLDDSEEHFVSLAVGDDGQPYVGTGVEGRVYTVDAAHNSLLVADTDERQIGALIMSGKQQWVSASDPAVLHPVRGVGGPDAVWTSKVLDAGIRARFGQLRWDARGTLEFSSRTGNTKEPDDTWSAWSQPLLASGLVASPPGRFIQVRARWSRDKDAVLSEVLIPFVTDNLRAVLTEIDASSGVKKGKKGGEGDEGGVKGSGGPIESKPDANVNLTWKVDNPDKDELRYRLQYRLVGTTTWYDMLKPNERLTKDTYTWETSALPEGEYRVRVVASDELSNPPDRVTRDTMESGIVLVDNTPPVIQNLRTAGRRIQGVIIDGVGPVQRIEVSVVGSDEWFPFFPKDGIFDEQREELDADVSLIAQQVPALLAIRVYDKANNFVVRNLALK